MNTWIVLVAAWSAVWVYFDATQNRIGKTVSGGFFNLSAGGWATSTALLWALGFPAYIIKRGSLIKAARAAPVEPSLRAVKLAILTSIAGLITWGALSGSQNQLASVQADYANDRLVVMDGEKAIGKTVHIQGFFTGIEANSQQGNFAKISTGQVVWFSRFSDQLKAQVAAFTIGQQVEVLCKIVSLNQTGQGQCDIVE